MRRARTRAGSRGCNQGAGPSGRGRAWRCRPSAAQLYAFRDASGELVACVLAEPVKEAWFLPRGAPFTATGALARRPAVCGVHRVWVKSTHRRSGLATRLLDALRYAGGHARGWGCAHTHARGGAHCAAPLHVARACGMGDRRSAHFVFGLMIRKDQVAFLQPTVEGRRLADAYTGGPGCLVY